jgi:hypothetical protein
MVWSIKDLTSRQEGLYNRKIKESARLGKGMGCATAGFSRD